MGLWIDRSSDCLAGFSAASRASFQMDYYEAFNYPFLWFFQDGSDRHQVEFGPLFCRK